MGGKEGQETGRKENGREGGNERKERGLGKRCQKGKKKKKARQGDKDEDIAKGHNFPARRPLPPEGRGLSVTSARRSAAAAAATAPGRAL